MTPFVSSLSREALHICSAGLAESTQAQYASCFARFAAFCTSHGHRDHLNIPVTLGVEFLTSLYREGKSYSTINSARSTLSQMVNISDGREGTDFGKHPLVIKFMRGMFKLRPALPRYNATWDVSTVLSSLRKVHNSSSTLRDLSLKCVMLVALATGHRVQTLTALSVKGLVELDNKLILHIPSVLKTTKPGSHTTFELFRFNED